MGTKHTPERIENIRRAMVGHVVTDETKAKMKATHAARWAIINANKPPKPPKPPKAPRAPRDPLTRGPTRKRKSYKARRSFTQMDSYATGREVHEFLSS